MCVCFLFVCTVTDFSAEDKASGVKLCTAVHLGVSHFVKIAPQKPKIGTNRSARGPRPPACKHYTSDIAYYSIHRPRKDVRLSWPSWLTYSGRLTQISGHSSAAGRAWDRESSPVKDQRSTTVQRNQTIELCFAVCFDRHACADMGP